MRFNSTLRREVIYPVGPSIAYIPLTKDQVCLVDFDDAVRLGEFNWTAMWEPRMDQYYVFRTIKVGSKRTTLRLYRELLGNPPNLDVDHINGNTLDNRRQNLRAVTHQENLCNRRFKKTRKFTIPLAFH